MTDATATKPSPRLDSVDLLRGLVMAIMVLDHVRDFFGVMKIGSTNIAETYPALFFTRWISHFCAPTFVLLAGTGAYLAGSRGKTTRELSWFLFTRGVWLVFLELTAVRFGMAWSFDPTRGFVQVIWAIGWSMVALSLLVYLPTWLIGGFGVGMCLLHNAMDPITPEGLGAFGAVWKVLHEGGLTEPFAGARYYVAYPLVPWIGVMAAGYALGSVITLPAERRRKLLLTIGLTLTAAFVLLRWSNLYGDPEPWMMQSRGSIYTVLSFLNCEKYPPSLLYLLMTLGPAITFLGLVDRGVGSVGKPLVTIGRVPLFFYLLQWPLAHAMALVVAMVRGEPYAWLLGGGFGRAPEGYGYPLPFVYVMWITALLILYPPCRWFADLKRRNRSAWLSYF